MAPPKVASTSCFRVVHQGSNDHVEVPIAIGTNVPQRATVQAAPCFFQPSDVLHGAEFGCPVMDPMGNVDRMMSKGEASGRRVHDTELIIWWTVAKE